MLSPSPTLIAKAQTVLHHAQEQRLNIATAESCTGGLISALLTSISGSSAVFNAGLVTYANSAKIAILGVPEEMLLRDGAVSENVARAMAAGACRAGGAHIAVAVTGIAGPNGGTPEKPVGLVHIAVASEDMATLHRRNLFHGDRDAVRSATVETALDMMIEMLELHRNA